MKTDLFGRKYTVSDWLSDNGKNKGTNKYSTSLLREFKAIDKMTARNNVISYLLIQNFGINELRSILVSGMKVRALVRKIKIYLKEYKVEGEYVEGFKKNIERFKRRQEYVFKIIQENVKFTEYAPYFNEYGYERLVTFGQHYPDSEEDTRSAIIEEIKEYNEGHKEEIARYMESVRKEKEIHEAYLEQIKEKARKEKEEKRAKRKAENAEVREIKKNNKRYESRRRRVERSFNYLYK